MLERYLTPILFSYVDKYVKNLAPSDLRLSLWQGEVVLNNLELRLDVLESDLGLPMQLVSGKIRRLHIQVPWTSLNSEPVRVTVDTLECVMKWKDDDSDSRSSHSLPGVPPQQTSTPPPAPGYIQSWTNRIVNNVQITFNNVVLKYVEEDIVLSVNIQEARIFAVGTDWQPSFSDASQPQDTLRKVLQVTDMTICLDKRDSSGRIPFYQEPLVYKLSFCTRILYNAKRKLSDGPSPQSGTTYDTYWENLDISVSNFQFPLFVRILKRIAAIYYGCNIDGGGMPVYLPVLMDDGNSYQKSQVSGQEVSSEDDGQQGAGWMSWAWSVVAG
jgi:vacuolar protein sorting-associated protein 13B